MPTGSSAGRVLAALAWVHGALVGAVTSSRNRGGSRGPSGSVIALGIDNELEGSKGIASVYILRRGLLQSSLGKIKRRSVKINAVKAASKKSLTCLTGLTSV